MTINIDYTVIDCSNNAIYLGTPMLIPMDDEKGNMIDVSQMPENLPPPPILFDIPKGSWSGMLQPARPADCS